MIAHHAATPAALCVGSGVPFSRSALVISRGICAGGRREYNGSSPCTPRALRPEGTQVGLIPPHVLAAPPLASADIVPTLYDPEEFAALYHADKERAIALIAAMTEPQRVCQAQ